MPVIFDRLYACVPSRTAGAAIRSSLSTSMLRARRRGGAG